MNRLDKFLEHLGELLSDADRRRKFLKEFPRRLRVGLRCGYVVFVVLALAFLGVVEWVGERNLFTVMFLFLPPQIWLIPLGLFFLAAICLLDWRLCLGIGLSALAFVWFYLDWETSGSKRAAGGKQLVVMTFNRGQRAGSLQPFKQLHAPDLLAMQEAARKSATYQRDEGYADLGHAEDIGEFMLLSKYPIIDKGLLEFVVDGNAHAIAAWFVIDFDGDEIVVYNVHLDTPRDQLMAFRRGAFLRGLWPFSAAAKSYQAFWDRQVELAGLLREHIAAEARPTIVVGDFNTPDHGYIYRKFAGSLQDAHESAGHGFGWTFPGTTRNPLTLFGPWLRIDHQFASEAWRVLDCRAESGRRSQHLAVAAKYELKN